MQDKKEGLVETTGGAKQLGERLQMQVFSGNGRVKGKWKNCQEKNRINFSAITSHP